MINNSILRSNFNSVSSSADDLTQNDPVVNSDSIIDNHSESTPSAEIISQLAEALGLPAEDLLIKIYNGDPAASVVVEATINAGLPDEILQILGPFLDNLLQSNTVSDQSINMLTNMINGLSHKTEMALTDLAEALDIDPEELLFKLKSGDAMTDIVDEAIFTSELPAETQETIASLLGAINEDQLVFYPELKLLTDTINSINQRTVDSISHLAEALGIDPEMLLYKLKTGESITEIVDDAIFGSDLPDESKFILEKLLTSLRDDGLMFNSEIKILTNFVNSVNSQTTNALSHLAEVLGLVPEELLFKLKGGESLAEIVNNAVFDSDLPVETKNAIEKFIAAINEDDLIFNSEITWLSNAINRINNRTSAMITRLADTLGIEPEALLFEIQNGEPIAYVVENALFNSELSDEVKQALDPVLARILNDGLVTNREIKRLTNAINRLDGAPLA